MTKLSAATQGEVERTEGPSWRDMTTALAKLDNGVLTMSSDDELVCMEICGEGRRYHVAVVRDESGVFSIWNRVPVGDEWEALGGNFYAKHEIVTDLAVVAQAAGTFFHEGTLDSRTPWVTDDGQVVPQ